MGTQVNVFRDNVRLQDIVCRLEDEKIERADIMRRLIHISCVHCPKDHAHWDEVLEIINKWEGEL